MEPPVPVQMVAGMVVTRVFFRPLEQSTREAAAAVERLTVRRSFRKVPLLAVQGLLFSDIQLSTPSHSVQG